MLGRKEGEFVTLKDVPAGQFIGAYADFLKKSNKIELPSWVDTVKTGHFHELAPYDDDWFYTKAGKYSPLQPKQPKTHNPLLRKHTQDRAIIDYIQST